jgi:predicted Co/Zn/Cd cation transporter (cation efflux family)
MMRRYMANEILKLSATAAMTGLLAGAGILSGACMAQASVTFNGVPATSFKVASDTFLTAVVPTGATTGKVVATTPSGARFGMHFMCTILHFPLSRPSSGLARIARAPL